MSQYTRKQVADRARASTHYATRMCMQWTRLMAGQDAVGDFDGDKASDAEDGWKSSKSQHPGDTKPPEGTMVFWGGGSADNGHAAISLGPDTNGNYWIRTTDGAGAGVNGTRLLSYPTTQWGMPYLGWTEGVLDDRIPLDAPPPKPEVKKTRGSLIDGALRKLKKAEGTGKRRKAINTAIEALESIKLFRKKP